ncbi:polymorphic toxin type 10 domain-containing protein, partial [Ravibacter arvi]|uniref:polymorphic toxin type 10 domain-containing protein n=1 Tax=Ravibacter arvi TaxID=2051041 RepID=UPI0031E8C680
WLRKVEGKTSAATNFGVELRYANASEAQHNGNIGEMLWLKDGAWNGYRLKYDGVNRLTEALNTDAANGIWEKVTEYDKNGNLKKLQRGKAAETWDNLEYFLSDNRLTSINDAGNANGVKNGSSAYAYDDGGNLTSDGNKGATIAYNRLNLPRSVSIGGKTLGYYYDGNGNKLRMANGAVNTKYAGLFEYDESNYLTRIATEEGQIAVTGNGNTYTPNYYLKDHLGNVRAVINKEGTILQETEYFPFGLAVPKTGNDAVNKYQFLNREKQPETGYMDLMRRFYDPTIGRFMQVDPVTETQENYSVYQYGWNNPILRSDPNGDCPGCPPSSGEMVVADDGRLARGIVESFKSTAAGLWNLVRHPIESAKAIGNAVMHPVETGQRIAEGVKQDFKNDPVVASGKVLGNMGQAVLPAGMIGKSSKVTNSVPSKLARVIPVEAGDVKTLGAPGSADVFVTAAQDIKGLGSAEISKKLTIPPSTSGFQIYEFATPQGIASPINRSNPGFVGGGRTAGGAREFVIPNQNVPKDAVKRIVE